MNIVLQEFLIHFFVGFGPCTVLIVYCNHQGKRRRSFRFGGESPLAFGSKTRWVTWFLLAYVFEFVTSLHPAIGARIYVEMALSLYQAGAAILGLFIADRLGMMFEPASYWLIEKTKKDDSAPKPVLEIKPDEKTWLAESLGGATEAIVENAKEATGEIARRTADAVETGREKVTNVLSARRQRQEEEARAKREAQDKERDHLRNLLKDY